MLVKDKVIIVTGGGSGIGQQLVLLLLAKGSKVAAVDINQTALEETYKLSSNHEQLRLYQVDISNRRDIETLVTNVINDFGDVDGIINNAGIIQPFVRINDLTYPQVEKVMNINFYGTLYLVKAVLPYLLKKNQGHIVNVSSMGGFLPVPGQAVYGASKSAVKLISEGLYAELKATNIDVTVVFPGAVKTNITTNSSLSGLDELKDERKYKMLSPSKAAYVIVKGMEKKKLYVYAGKDSMMMGKLYRLMPKRSTNLIAKKMASILK